MRAHLAPAILVTALLVLLLFLGPAIPIAALTGFTAAPAYSAAASGPDLQLTCCSAGLCLPVDLRDMAPGVWYDGACAGVANAAGSGARMSYTFHVVGGSPWESAAGFFDLLHARVHTGSGGDPHSWPLVYEGRLWDLLVGPAACELDPGAAHYYFFEFRVHDSAGNLYQGAQARCDLIFEATALAGPGGGDNGPTAGAPAPVAEPVLYLLPVTGSPAP